ncbi:MAG: PorT family protein [Algicola sp.]|nr:PorT family protein [Algicola sp.]
MRKIYCISALLIFGLLKGYAQEEQTSSNDFNFGVKAGYSSVILKVKVDDISVSDDVSGFYFGVFGELSFSEKFGFQPEVIYSSYSQDGESSSVLQVPLLIKFIPAERFGIMAGPQFDYLLNKEDAEGLKQLAVGIALGASFDITENIIIETRYSFGLTDRLDSDLEGLEGFNVENRFNYFFVGLAYRF